MADGELPGHAVHDVEADREDDVDADAQRQDHQEGRIGGQSLQQQQHRHSDGEGQQAFDDAVHTFSAVTRPKMPSGRTNKTRIKKPNATASRQVELP